MVFQDSASDRSVLSISPASSVVDSKTAAAAPSAKMTSVCRCLNVVNLVRISEPIKQSHCCGKNYTHR